MNSQQLWRRMATKVLCTVPRHFYLLTTSKDKSCVWFDWKSSPWGYCWTNGSTRSVGPFHGLDILFGTMAEQLFFSTLLFAKFRPTFRRLLWCFNHSIKPWHRFTNSPWKTISKQWAFRLEYTPCNRNCNSTNSIHFQRIRETNELKCSKKCLSS